MTKMQGRSAQKAAQGWHGFMGGAGVGVLTEVSAVSGTPGRSACLPAAAAVCSLPV